MKKITPSWKIWFLASRPRTLPISCVPIIVAATFASEKVAQLDWLIIFSALFCSFFIQIGTNLINDALDFKKGADKEGRIGPIRVTQTGLVSFQRVMTIGCACLFIALCWGIPLIFKGGISLLIILLLSVACAYLYTGGPYPLAYLGISDFFILIFFGWVSTCTVFYLLTDSLTWQIFIAATQIGCLAIIPHAINNLRDEESDKIALKNTLVVRFGSHFGKIEILFLCVAAFLLGLYWIGQDKLFAALFPLLAAPGLFSMIYTIWKSAPSIKYNQYLAKSALLQFLFGCLLAFGYKLG